MEARVGRPVHEAHAVVVQREEARRDVVVADAGGAAGAEFAVQQADAPALLDELASDLVDQALDDPRVGAGLLPENMCMI